MLGFLANDRYDHRLHHGGPKRRIVKRKSSNTPPPPIQFVQAPPLKIQMPAKIRVDGSTNAHRQPTTKKEDSPIWMVVLHTLWTIFQNHYEQSQTRLSKIEDLGSKFLS